MATVTAPALDHIIREQSTLVGGSELHHVLNLEPYGCARQLAYKKSGAKPDYPFHGNQHTERGLELEDLIAVWYARKTGRTVQRVAGAKAGIAKRDRDYTFIGCHADRELLNPNGLTLLNGTAIAPGRPGILSIKAPGEYAMRKLLEAQEMPLGYVAQLQYELSIYRRDWGSYAFGGIVDDAIEVVYFDQVYNEALAEDIRAQVKWWWARFIQGESFGKLDAEDARCTNCPWRTTCQGEAILNLAEREAGKTEDGDAIEKDEDAEWTALIKEYVRRLEAEKVAGTLKEATTKRILSKMGERVAVLTLAGKVYAKPQVQERMQSKEVAEILSNQAAIAGKVIEAVDAGLDFTDPKVLSAAMSLIGEIARLPGLIEEKFTTRSAFRAVRPYPTKAVKQEALAPEPQEEF